MSASSALRGADCLHPSAPGPPVGDFIVPWGGRTWHEVLGPPAAQGAGDVALTLSVPSAPSVEALDVASRWLVDTGASRDMTDHTVRMRFPNSLVQVPPILLATGNGVVEPREALNINIRQLGNATGLPYIMKSSPSALAVGRRCMEQGFGYHWVTTKITKRPPSSHLEATKRHHM